MSEYITGKLVAAGDYIESDNAEGEATMARVLIVMERETLRDVKRLPMYHDVTVIRSYELDKLRAELDKLTAIVWEAQKLHSCSRDMVPHWCERAKNRADGAEALLRRISENVRPGVLPDSIDADLRAAAKGQP